MRTLEEELTQAAEALIVKGKEHGYLTLDDILESFPETEAEPDQVFRIFAAFKEIGIEVADGEKDLEEVEAIADEMPLDIEMTDSVLPDDSIRLYLKEIGQVCLLSAADEVDLAKQIEAGSCEAKQRLTEANPPAGGLGGQEVLRLRHVSRRPDPRGKHRPDPGGREIRLPQRLQILHLRLLVDPAGNRPSGR
jgi:Sigma-70 factor, region 1.2/Sigma-70 factor, region 1.1